jgi:hypothetical protein
VRVSGLQTVTQYSYGCSVICCFITVTWICSCTGFGTQTFELQGDAQHACRPQRERPVVQQFAPLSHAAPPQAVPQVEPQLDPHVDAHAQVVTTGCSQWP